MYTSHKKEVMKRNLLATLFHILTFIPVVYHEELRICSYHMALKEAEKLG
jgi:hypothetical protein